MLHLAFLPPLGIWEIVIILVVVGLIFGPRLYIRLGKSIIEGFKEMVKATKGDDTKLPPPDAPK